MIVNDSYLDMFDRIMFVIDSYLDMFDRVMFANVIALLWNIYLSNKTSSSTLPVLDTSDHKTSLDQPKR